MRALPQLEEHRGSLEKCVFCPKLCRSACPVSNAEPRETITPWGKMSLAWMTAHGDVPTDTSHGAAAWACTGCHACREACDHENGVADVLFATRDALARRGVMPSSAQRAVAGFARHDDATRKASRNLAASACVDARAPDAVLVGCGYVRAFPAEARDALAVAAAIGDGRVAMVERCCGLPLRIAGDATGFTRHARAVAQGLRDKRRVTVVDAGCALTLRRTYADVGVHLDATVDVLVERAAQMLHAMSRVDAPAGPVRWHDPCQLGRGLGIYDAPRALLSRALGRAPDEFDDRRTTAVCSGAGGLLPSTMPDVSRDIALARLDAHRRAGGGRIVTGCASSLRSLRRHAKGTGIEVDDLVTWLARSFVPGQAGDSPDPRPPR